MSRSVESQGGRDHHGQRAALRQDRDYGGQAPFGPHKVETMSGALSPSCSLLWSGASCPGLEDLARQRLSLSQTDAADYDHLSPWCGRRVFGRGTSRRSNSEKCPSLADAFALEIAAVISDITPTVVHHGIAMTLALFPPASLVNPIRIRLSVGQSPGQSGCCPKADDATKSARTRIAILIGAPLG